MAVNKRIDKILQARFKELLKSGEFPEVGYEETVHSSGHVFHSYSLFAYNKVMGKFYKIVNDLVIKTGEEQGIWTRKYNKPLLDKITEICNNVTASDVHNQDIRYTSWVDKMLGDFNGYI